MYAIKCKSIYEMYIGTGPSQSSTVHWRDSSPSPRHLYCVYRMYVFTEI